jgi:hypothetical protein
MAYPRCRYCGKTFGHGGYPCKDSPVKIHVAVADGSNCIYCGKKYYSGDNCPDSPSKKHQLDI